MAIYFLLFLWFIVCAVIYRPFEPKLRTKLEFISAVIPATALAAFRGISVGTDTQQYADALTEMKTLGYTDYIESGLYSSYEFGFTGLMRFCSLFPNPIHILIILSSLIIIIIPFFVISKMTKEPALVYCIYFLTTQYFMALSAMRQSIAIAFVFVSILVYSKTGSPWKATLFILLAACFHMTSLILIPLLFIARIRANEGLFFILPFLVAVVLVLGRYLPMLFVLIPKYQGYVSYGGHFLTAGKFMPLLQIAFFTIFLIILKSGNRDDYPLENNGLTTKTDYLQNDMIINNLAIYSSAIGILIGVSTLYVNVFYRFMYEVLPFIIIVIPSVFLRVRRSKFSIIMRILCVGSLLALFISFITVARAWFGIDPYVLWNPANNF